MTDVARLGFAIDSAPLKQAADALDRMKNAATPAAEAMRKVEQATSSTRSPLKTFADGVAGTASSANVLTGNFDKASRSVERFAHAGQQSAKVIALNGNAMRNLGMQANDAATMLLSGSSPFQVIATQGGQVLQVLQGANGGVTGALKQIGSGLANLVSVSRVAGVAFAAAATIGVLAWNAWDEKIKSVQQALNGLGRQTGLTGATLTAIAQQAAAVGPISMGQAMQGATAFAGAGVYGSTIAGLLPLSRRISGATGESLTDTQSMLAGAFGDPVRGMEDLAKRFGQFDIQVELNIRRLDSLGKKEEAQLALLEALNARFKDTTDTTGYLAKAMEALRSGASGLWTRIGQIGAPDLQLQMKSVRERYDLEARTFNRKDVLEDLFQQYEKLLEKAGQAAKKAENDRAEAERIRNERVKRENDRIIEQGQLSVQATLARTAAEKLAVEVDRIRRDAIYDTAKAATQAAEAERARTQAVADATKALRDYQRSAADEAFMGGARNPLQEFIRRTQIEMRQLREQTDVLPPDSQWRSQVKIGEESRAGNLWSPSPVSPFKTYGDFGAMPSGEFGRNLTKREMQGLEDIARAVEKVAPIARAAVSGPRELTVSNRDPNAPGAPDMARVEAWQKNRTEQLFYDTQRAAEAQARGLQTSIDTFGKSTFEIARANEALRLENEIKRLGIEDTSRYTDEIKRLAEQEGRLAEVRERVGQAQQRMIQDMDTLRSGAADALSSPFKALLRGESISKAMQQSALRLGDKLIDRSTNLIIESVLGMSGKAGGGLLGDLLGKLMGTVQPVGAMNVNAAVVNVGGAAAAAGVSGGGGIFAGLFGGSSSNIGPGTEALFANGGIMTSRGPLPLNTYAKGGVANSPQVALFGEGRGPEAFVPLPDGRSIPVAIKSGRESIQGAARQAQGALVQVFNQTSSKVETRTGKQPDGREFIEFVISEVGEAMAAGRFDAPQQARFNMRPTKVFR